MAYKAKTGIFVSKTQEDIKVLGLVDEGGRWGFIVGEKSHEDLGVDGWEEQRKIDIDEMGFGRNLKES